LRPKIGTLPNPSEIHHEEEAIRKRSESDPSEAATLADDGTDGEPAPQRSGDGKKPARDIAPSRQWCLTWHDYQENWEQQFECLRSCKLTGHIIGEEVRPKTMKPHLQGWVELCKKGRPTELKLAEQIHWEKSRGSPQDNYKYCTEDGKAVFWGSGATVKPYKVVLELYQYQIKLVEYLGQETGRRMKRPNYCARNQYIGCDGG
jgi:hypothetical protein